MHSELYQVNNLLQSHSESYDDGGGLIEDRPVLNIVILE